MGQEYSKMVTTVKYGVVEFDDMENVIPSEKTRIIETYESEIVAKARAYDLKNNLEYPQNQYKNYWVRKL